MASTAVAERPQQQDRAPANPLVILRHELEQRAGEFKMVLPAHISPEKFQRTIITAVQSNPKLLQADRRSFITSCMKAAQDGLLPDGREAALVEFKTRQKGNDGQFHDVRLVQYMPMVYGLRKKILQSGEIKAISANVVYRQEVEAGLFVYEEGTERMLRHKPLLDPDFDPKDEDIVAAYSIAMLSDGSYDFDVMRRTEINKVRQMSQTGAVGQTVRFGANKGNPIEPKGPWVDWFSEMAKKTVIRRHSKTLPMSGDIIDVEAADEALAARSAVAALGSASEEPAQLSPPRRGEGGDLDTVDEVDHDEETGEIIEGEKAKPKRQSKPKKEERQDTATKDNPAAAEGKADEDRGESHNGTEAITLDDAKRQIDACEIVADVNSRTLELMAQLPEGDRDDIRTYALDKIEAMKAPK